MVPQFLIFQPFRQHAFPELVARTDGLVAAVETLERVDVFFFSSGHDENALIALLSIRRARGLSFSLSFSLSLSLSFRVNRARGLSLSPRSGDENAARLEE